MSGAAALSVGSLESGGGGGLQADLLTFESLGVTGASVAVTVAVQDGASLTAVHEVPLAAVREQLRAARQGPPSKAVKVGLVTTVPIIRLLGAELPGLLAPIVID